MKLFAALFRRGANTNFMKKDLLLHDTSMSESRWRLLLLRIQEFPRYRFVFFVTRSSKFNVSEIVWFGKLFFMSTGADWSPAHQLCAQEQTNQEKNEVKIHYLHDYCKLFQSNVAEIIRIGMEILDLGEIRAWIFKLLKSPRIYSKKPISARLRAGTTTLFLLDS